MTRATTLAHKAASMSPATPDLLPARPIFTQGGPHGSYQPEASSHCPCTGDDCGVTGDHAEVFRPGAVRIHALRRPLLANLEGHRPVQHRMQLPSERKTKDELQPGRADRRMGERPTGGRGLLRIFGKRGLNNSGGLW